MFEKSKVKKEDFQKLKVSKKKHNIQKIPKIQKSQKK